MREQLLGYLLNALEPAERREVERALESSALLRAELESVRFALARLEMAEEVFEPPASLSERTCDIIFQHDWLPENGAPTGQATFHGSDEGHGSDAGHGSDDLDAFDPGLLEADAFARSWNLEDDELFAGGEELAQPAKSQASWRTEPAQESLGAARIGSGGGAPMVRTWSFADFVVATGVFLAAAFLFFPAIASSRNQSQRIGCESNLRRLSTALVHYANAHQGRLAPIPLEGKLAVAGIYGPTLVHNQYLERPEYLICPGSPWAGARGRWRLPAVEEVEQAEGEALLMMQQMMGGSYGYNLGYIAEGEYRPTRMLDRSFFAVLGDAASSELAGRRSLNHGQTGQNVLYEDGHIRFVIWTDDAILLDDPFFNLRGQVSAGIGVNDAVLGSSAVPPFSARSPLDFQLISGR